MRRPLDTPALQREIQRAGSVSYRCRTAVPFIGVILLLQTLGFLALEPYLDPVPRLASSAVALLGGLISAAFALPPAGPYRRLRRRQLRQKLARLPRQQLADLLLPLRSEPLPDTRHIVAPLIRDLLPPGGEVTPSHSPAGAGSELGVASPAGEP